jgi:hypothetical protein
MRTRINMTKENYIKLDRASKETGLHKSELLKRCLKYFESNYHHHVQVFRAVKYQEKKPREGWVSFHFSVTEIEYEVFTDLRNFCKLSLSLVVAIVIKDYLGNVISRVMDNCPTPFPIYILTRQVSVDGMRIMVDYDETVYWELTNTA